MSESSAPHNKSLDASGGSVFRNLIHAAMLDLIRAAASTQPFARIAVSERRAGDPINAQLVWMIPSLPLRVLTRRAAFLLTPNQLRVTINGRSNKSLDASGGSVFLKINSTAKVE